MDSEITLRMENWQGGDWDETQNATHIMRRQGCAMQNQGITLSHSLGLGPSFLPPPPPAPIQNNLTTAKQNFIIV